MSSSSCDIILKWHHELPFEWYYFIDAKALWHSQPHSLSNKYYQSSESISKEF
jgi:hypothetical protein